MQVGRTADGTFSFQGRPSSADNLASFFDAPESASAFYFGSQRVNVGRVNISDEFTLKPEFIQTLVSIAERDTKP